MKITTDACVFGALADFLGCCNILDIGAGTGLLTLMLAQKMNQNTLFTAIELDKSASDELKINCIQSPWAEKITVINEDIKIFASKPSNHALFDGIIANPPFFSSDLKSPNYQKNAVRHEENNLSMVELLQCAKLLLSKRGKLLCLYPIRRLDEFKEKTSVISFRIKRLTYLHHNKNKAAHLFMAELSNQNESETIESQFFIKDNNEYSNEFVSLLKDYYLKLI
ncbi:MAG: methyltransferase [Bacteroidetes bacterium]|nr:methyltransferase [Bacteroidota bacterium]